MATIPYVIPDDRAWKIIPPLAMIRDGDLRRLEPVDAARQRQGTRGNARYLPEIPEDISLEPKLSNELLEPLELLEMEVNVQEFDTGYETSITVRQSSGTRETKPHLTQPHKSGGHGGGIEKAVGKGARIMMTRYAATCRGNGTYPC